MEVAVLTARLQAEIAAFQANMRAADSMLRGFEDELDKASVRGEILEKALNKIEIGQRQMLNSVANLRAIGAEIDKESGKAKGAGSAMKDMKPGVATTAEAIAQIRAITSALEDEGDAANRATAAMMAAQGVGMVGAYGRSNVPRGGGGRFLPGQWQTRPEYSGNLVPYLGDLLTQQHEAFLRSRIPIPMGPGGPSGYFFQQSESYGPGYARKAGRDIGRVLGGEMVTEWARSDPFGSISSTFEDSAMVIKRSTGEMVKAFERSAPIRGDVAGAMKFLKGKGITYDPSALGGMGTFRRADASEAGLAAAVGAGGGRGIWNPFRMFGFGGWGRGRLFPGMAPFGSLLGLAGFGAERAVTSTLGIAGSLGGGLLGGGLLGAGYLGTTAVGAGTNLAGIGQAIGDTRTVSHDLSQLSDAIARYGKNSRQAATAQAQLNQDLKGFSPIARNAVLAAAQTSQGFKDMFDKLTGPAEKVGANIINQVMRVGERFLPTIGAFAEQNMKIIQSGLQPFFTWLKSAGPSGGLGIFRDLEKIFQKNLPTAIHAFTQAFEFITRTIDVAAQHTGGFIKKLDEFFTRMNQPGAFSKWTQTVNNMIGLFHVWMGLFVSLGKLIFDLFKPAVHFGEAFAAGLTNIINRMRDWVNTKTMQKTLTELFAAHLSQLNAIFNIIKAIGPALGEMAKMFLEVEIQMSKLTAGVLQKIADVINEIMKIPFAKQVIGWVAAVLLMQRAVKGLLAILGFGGLLKTLGSVGAASKSTSILMGGTFTKGINTAERATITFTERMAILRGILFSLAAKVIVITVAYEIYKHWHEISKAAQKYAGQTAAIQAQEAMLPPGGKLTQLAPNSWRITYPATGTQPMHFIHTSSLDQLIASGYYPKSTGGKSGNVGGRRPEPGATGVPTPYPLRFSKALLTLPMTLQDEMTAAENITNAAKSQAAIMKASKDAADYYIRLLKIPGLTVAQRRAIKNARIPYAQSLISYSPAPVPSAGTYAPGGTGGAGGTLAGLIGPHLAVQLSNAQGAAASGSTKSLQHLLATEQKVLVALNAQHESGKKLVQQARERAILEKEIAATKKKLGEAVGRSALDKLLGIGTGTSQPSSIKFRLHQTLLEELERLVGGKKHTLATAAAALGISPSQLGSESLAKIMKQIGATGFKFSDQTLKAINLVRHAIMLIGSKNLTLSTKERTKLGDLLTQINDTLKGSVSSQTNYMKPSITSLAEQIPGLTEKQKLIAEALFAGQQAHGGKVPTGAAGAGYALPSGTGLGYRPTTTTHKALPPHRPGPPWPEVQTGPVTIVIQGAHKDGRVLAREIRQELIKTSRRNTTQTRGPNAGKNVALT